MFDLVENASYEDYVFWATVLPTNPQTIHIKKAELLAINQTCTICLHGEEPSETLHKKPHERE